VGHRQGVKINILTVIVLGGLLASGSLGLAGPPLSLQTLRALETKQGAETEVKSLCNGWNWDLIDASVFVEKDFAGDRNYMVDRASVADRRTGQKFIVGIVINKDTGDANSMPNDYLSGFLVTGEIPHLNSDPSLDVN
jgi:hypothetical protein